MSRDCKCDSKSEELKDHVRNCTRCHVFGDGSVWYCAYANLIIQEQRKEKFFPKRDTKWRLSL